MVHSAPGRLSGHVQGEPIPKGDIKGYSICATVRDEGTGQCCQGWVGLGGRCSDIKGRRRGSSGKVLLSILAVVVNTGTTKGGNMQN